MNSETMRLNEMDMMEAFSTQVMEQEKNGAIVVLIFNARHSFELFGPFRNMRSAKDWVEAQQSEYKELDYQICKTRTPY